MSLQTLKNQKGFTIVELLIVIVVIGILAAITIVAYNGVQNNAKTTTAVSSADNVIKKAELYNTEESSYPASLATLTGADRDKSYRLDGVASGTPASSAAPTTVSYTVCLAGTTRVGAQIGYWDYKANAAASKSAGITSGTVGSDTVTCS